MSMPNLSAIAGARERYPRLARGMLELVLVLGLWVAYSLSRLLASNAMGPALRRAHELLSIEKHLGIHWEQPLNQLFTANDALGLVGSYWYATLHYIITGIALLWLYRVGSRIYVPARRALVVGTILGLVTYLLLPTAGGAATPRPPEDWAASPTSWRRSRRCMPAGRSGSPLPSTGTRDGPGSSRSAGRTPSPPPW